MSISKTELFIIHGDRVMDDKEIINKMHHLWTKAIGNPDYNKEEWKDFEKDLLEKLEIISKLKLKTKKKD